MVRTRWLQRRAGRPTAGTGGHPPELRRKARASSGVQCFGTDRLRPGTRDPTTSGFDRNRAPLDGQLHRARQRGPGQVYRVRRQGLAVLRTAVAREARAATPGSPPVSAPGPALPEPRPHVRAAFAAVVEAGLGRQAAVSVDAVEVQVEQLVDGEPAADEIGTGDAVDQPPRAHSRRARAAAVRTREAALRELDALAGQRVAAERWP